MLGVGGGGVNVVFVIEDGREDERNFRRISFRVERTVCMLFVNLGLFS